MESLHPVAKWEAHRRWWTSEVRRPTHVNKHHSTFFQAPRTEWRTKEDSLSPSRTLKSTQSQDQWSYSQFKSNLAQHPTYEEHTPLSSPRVSEITLVACFSANGWLNSWQMQFCMAILLVDGCWGPWFDFWSEGDRWDRWVVHRSQCGGLWVLTMRLRCWQSLLWREIFGVQLVVQELRLKMAGQWRALDRWVEAARC